MNSKNVAVVLSGCGHRDGAEITESVSTLIALGQNGASYQVFAPDMDAQASDPMTGEATLEKRNVLRESARIARGNVKPLSELNPLSFDALVFPGGYGAAKVLGTWAMDGKNSKVLPDIKRVIEGFYSQGKPIAAICIAPTLIAKVLGEKGITLTIGNDKATAQEIEKTGAIHEPCKVTEFISDREHKIISTPAYMYDEASPYEVFQGISKAIKELAEMS